MGCDKLIVLCAANSYDAVKATDQHIAESLSATGPVLYVDPPISLVSRGKAGTIKRSFRGRQLRRVAPALMRFTPVVTPFAFRNIAHIPAGWLIHLQLKHAVRKLGGNVKAVISEWPVHPVFECFREAAKIYWATDDFVGGAALLGLDAGLLARNEQKIVRAADVIVSVSPVLERHWRDRGFNSVLIPNGVDLTAYAGGDALPRPCDAILKPPVAGFIGHINARTDLGILKAVAEQGLSLLLIGPVSADVGPEAWKSLLARPNVKWLGRRPFNELPAYLNAMDVGLVPYVDSDFNRASFPLKTLEYLAAGLPVVSTGLPSTKWLNSDLVTIADEPAVFAKAAETQALRRHWTSEIVARRALASRHAWSARAVAFNGVIQTILNQKSSGRSMTC